MRRKRVPMTFKRYALIVLGGFTALTAVSLITGENGAKWRRDEFAACVSQASAPLRRTGRTADDIRSTATMLCQFKFDGVPGLTH